MGCSSDTWQLLRKLLVAVMLLNSVIYTVACAWRAAAVCMHITTSPICSSCTAALEAAAQRMQLPAKLPGHTQGLRLIQCISVCQLQLCEAALASPYA
jgi:hypothetical protein